MDDIEQLLFSHYSSIAKFSKYVDVLSKKLERLFDLKKKGITEDEKVLHQLLLSFGGLLVARDFVGEVSLLRKEIVVLNSVAGSKVIDPGVIKVTDSLVVTDRKEEVKHLFDTFNSKVKELALLFGEEKRIVAELHQILDFAKKRNLRYIVKHVDKVLSKVNVNFERQNIDFSKNLKEFMDSQKINELSYNSGVREFGRFYFPDKDKLNGKAVVVYAGTTLNFRQYEPLSYRFALEGFMVLALNLPSHGGDLNFRLGNGATQLGDAIRVLRSKGFVKVGVIGFSFGALSALYNQFSFDYGFEQELSRKIDGYVKLLGNGNIVELKSRYQELKGLVHRSVLRSFGSVQKFGVGLVPSRDRGLADALIFCGMPISLFESKKLVCPSAVSISYGWMKFCTNAAFNDPKVKLLRKIVNGLEHHQPIEEPTYKNKDSVYMKFFEIQDKNEFKELKDYMKDLSKDPKNLIPLLIANSDGQYIQYYLKRVRESPKLFLYGEKDAIASGNFFKEVFSRVFGNSKNISFDSVKFLIDSVSKNGELKIYPSIGHTLDERAGFFKKLSRRPQGIDIQNDMVGFLNKNL